MPDQHPDPDLLTAFCEGALRPVEREQMLAHLATCAQCREVVALITPAEGPPRTIPKPQRIWLTFPVLRWAAVAATATVVLAVALLHRPQAPRPNLRSDAEVPISKDSATSAKVGNERIAESQPVEPQKEGAAAPAVASAPAKSTTNKDREELNRLIGPAAANTQAKSTTGDTELRSREQHRRLAEAVPPSSSAVLVEPGSGDKDLDSVLKKEKAGLGAIRRELRVDGGTNEQTTVHLPSAQAPHGPAPPSQQQVIIQNTVPVAPPTVSGSGSDQQKKQGPSAGYAYGGPVVVGAAAPPVGTASEATRQPASAGARSSAQLARNVNSLPARGSESNAAPAPPPAAASASVADEAGKSAGEAASKTQSGTVDSFAMGGVVHGTLAKAVDVRWNISPQGKLLRSAGAAAPQIVTVANDLSFHAVASIASDVWAGGARGVLYHSTDVGATWKRVPLPTIQDIISIEFSNVRDGLITTSDGQHYATSDGGQNWQVTDGH
jgi:hypothetical protein